MKESIKIEQEKEMALKFKVGDKVKLVSYTFTWDEPCSDQHIVGTVTEIRQISGNSAYPYTLVIEGEAHSIRESDLELVRAKSKFKVGDFVKYNGCFGVQYAIVSEIKEDAYGTGYNIYGNWFLDKDEAKAPENIKSDGFMPEERVIMVQESIKYPVGTVLLDSDDDYVKVLATVRHNDTNYYVVSEYNSELSELDDERPEAVRSESDMDRMYTVYLKEGETKEFTLEEIAEKFGIATESIRIKE